VRKNILLAAPVDRPVVVGRTQMQSLKPLQLRKPKAMLP